MASAQLSPVGGDAALALALTQLHCRSMPSSSIWKADRVREMKFKLIFSVCNPCIVLEKC